MQINVFVHYRTTLPFAAALAAVGGGYMTTTDNIHMEMANARVRVPVDVTNEGGSSIRGVEGGPRAWGRSLYNRN